MIRYICCGSYEAISYDMIWNISYGVFDRYVAISDGFILYDFLFELSVGTNPHGWTKTIKLRLTGFRCR